MRRIKELLLLIGFLVISASGFAQEDEICDGCTTPTPVCDGCTPICDPCSDSVRIPAIDRPVQSAVGVDLNSHGVSLPAALAPTTNLPASIHVVFDPLPIADYNVPNYNEPINSVQVFIVAGYDGFYAPPGDHNIGFYLDLQNYYYTLNGSGVANTIGNILNRQTELIISGAIPAPQGSNAIPCNKIKLKIQEARFVAKWNELKTKTGLQNETGYAEDLNGDFVNMPVDADGNTVEFPSNPARDFNGAIHTHLDDFIKRDKDGDGESEVSLPIRMFSPRDVRNYLSMAQYASNVNNGRHALDTYLAMVSSTGNYILKFTGTKTELDHAVWAMTAHFPKWKSLEAKFRRKMGRDRYPYIQERNFLAFVRDILPIGGLEVKGLSLFKINDDGTIVEKTLQEGDSSNSVIDKPCH